MNRLRIFLLPFLLGSFLGAIEITNGHETLHLDETGLIRSITRPTRAAVDWAAAEANPLITPKAPNDPATTVIPSLSAPIFKDVLELSQNPPAAKDLAIPLAWSLMFPWLEKSDYAATEGLSKVASAISKEKWGGRVSGQEIAAAYLLPGADGGSELMLLIEFMPWIKVGEGFGDHNKNGRPDFFASVRKELMPTGSPVPALIERYQTELLDEAGVAAQFSQIAGAWYNRYETYSIDPTSWVAGIPEDAEISDSLREPLGRFKGTRPLGILRGKPRGTWIYNVFFIGEESQAGSTPARAAIDELLAQTPPESPVVVAQNVLFLKESVEALVASIPQEPTNHPFEVLSEAARQLASRNIKLLIVPVPLKERLMINSLLPTASPNTDVGVQFQNFWKRLRTEGVEVADLLPILQAQGADAFLVNDTHWTPQAAAACAHAVARILGTLRDQKKPTADRTLLMNGDLREMLPAEEQRVSMGGCPGTFQGAVTIFSHVPY
jgi:hypothetical protein